MCLLVPAYPGCPGQKLLNGCVCVCVCITFTVCASVVIRSKHSLQGVSNEDCYQFMVSLIFATVFTVFSTVPAKIVFAMAETQPCVREILDWCMAGS